MLVLASSRFTRGLCLCLRRTCKPAFSRYTPVPSTFSIKSGRLAYGVRKQTNSSEITGRWVRTEVTCVLWLSLVPSGSRTGGRVSYTPVPGAQTPMHGSQTPMYGSRTPMYGSQTPTHGDGTYLQWTALDVFELLLRKTIWRHFRWSAFAAIAM